MYHTRYPLLFTENRTPLNTQGNGTKKINFKFMAQTQPSLKDSVCRNQAVSSFQF